MSTSDWLQIVFSLIGVLAGAGISWLFFRAQQSTDFNKLRELLAGTDKSIATLKLGDDNKRAQQSTDLNAMRNLLVDIATSVAILKDADRLSQKIDLVKDLSSMRFSVETLNNNVNHLSATIIGEVRGQLESLLKSVSDEFDKQIEISRDVLKSSIDKELEKTGVSLEQRDKVSNTIVDNINDILKTMGRYQRIAIANQSAVALNNVESKAVGAINEVSKDARQIQSKVESIAHSLPPKS